MEPLGVIREWVAPYVGESGKNKSDPEVLEAINEARRIIYPVGNWKDTIQPIALSAVSGFVTLPFWADVIRNAWHGTRGAAVEGWYHTLSGDWNHWCGSPCMESLIDLGDRFASFLPAVRPFRLKIIPHDDRDKGTVLVFHGTSEYNQPVLLTRVLCGAWVPVISDPASDQWIRSFHYCQKPKTHGRIEVYIFDPVRGVDTLCALYEPDEVNPHYRRYRSGSTRSIAGRGSSLIATVKKKFRELTDDRELVDIHTDALIHLLQGITARRNRDVQGYAAQVKAAQNFLDRELQSEKPMQTFFLKMSPTYRDTNLGFEGGECCPY